MFFNFVFFSDEPLSHTVGSWYEADEAANSTTTTTTTNNNCRRHSPKVKPETHILVCRSHCSRSSSVAVIWHRDQSKLHDQSSDNNPLMLLTPPQSHTYTNTTQSSILFSITLSALTCTQIYWATSIFKLLLSHPNIRCSSITSCMLINSKSSICSIMIAQLGATLRHNTQPAGPLSSTHERPLKSYMQNVQHGLIYSNGGHQRASQLLQLFFFFF